MAVFGGFRFLFLFLCLAGGGGAVSAGALHAAQIGPKIGAASRFGQTWNKALLQAAINLPVIDFRDEIYWRRIEPAPGRFRFDQPTTVYPERIGAAGGLLSLMVAGRNPAYDNDDTPHSPSAVYAFGRMIVKILKRFPTIRSVEVGNEFNGEGFIKGPLRDGTLDARARGYVALLKSAYEQIKPIRPDIRIIGGAAHSIPVGYLAKVFADGGGQYMDALAIHPYTTKVAQLARQIAVLRRIAAVRHLPIEVTEFGTENIAAAPAKLLTGYCQLALSGVTRLVWYPLAARGDGLAPLLRADGLPTPVGRTFARIARRLVGQPVENIAPDPFTYGCRFGLNTVVIWGAPRPVVVTPDIRVSAADGSPVSRENLTLSMDRPLMLEASRPIVIGRNLRLGVQEIVADSFYQYAYPAPDGSASKSDPFTRFSFRNGRKVTLVLSPGQTAPGTMWTPSLADPGDGYLRLTASALRPDGTGRNPVEVVHRYVAPRDQRLSVRASFAPRPESRDGIRVDITLNGQTIGGQRGKARFVFVRAGLDLHKGDRLEFRVGPNGNAAGDVTDYRITLRNEPVQARQ